MSAPCAFSLELVAVHLREAHELTKERVRRACLEHRLQDRGHRTERRAPAVGAAVAATPNPPVWRTRISWIAFAGAISSRASSGIASMALERHVAKDELEREGVLGLDHLASRLGLGAPLRGDGVGDRHHRLGFLQRRCGARLGGDALLLALGLAPAMTCIAFSRCALAVVSTVVIAASPSPPRPRRAPSRPARGPAAPRSASRRSACRCARPRSPAPSR